MRKLLAILLSLVASQALAGSYTPTWTAFTVGTGALAVTAPTRSAGDPLIVFTDARASSETLTTPSGWTALSAAFSGGNGRAYCRIATNDASDNWSADWSGTSHSGAVMLHLTGDNYGDCATIVHAYSNRTSGSSSAFPYQGLTITEDDTFVVIYGQKVKTATSDGATINAEAGFTEGAESGPNSTTAFRWAGYVQQTTAANITSGDLDFTGTTETDIVRGFTLALRTATAVVDGVELTSIASDSLCATLNAAITPDIAIGDIVVIDATVAPSGADLTVAADCNMSYLSNGLRQTATIQIYDDSAAALMTGSTLVYFGNQVPVATQPTLDLTLTTGAAMNAVDFADYFTDFEGDALTCTNDNGGVGSGNDLRPTGTSISGCDWTGTPTTAQAGNFTVTATDIAGDTATLEVLWQTLIPLSFSSVTVLPIVTGYALLVTPNSDMEICAVAVATNLTDPDEAEIFAGTDGAGNPASAADCEDATAGNEVALTLSGLALPRYSLSIVGFSVSYTDISQFTGALKSPPANRQYIEVSP